MAIRSILVLAAAAALGGCTTYRQDFPDAGAGEVWTALVAAAETPEYRDWTLQDNQVWVDERNQRIEVYRRVHRDLPRPGGDMMAESRTWRFEILLAQLDPPAAIFVSRGWAVPAHAHAEAQRYFDRVWSLLSAMKAVSAGPSQRQVLDALGLDEE